MKISQTNVWSGLCGSGTRELVGLISDPHSRSGIGRDPPQPYVPTNRYPVRDGQFLHLSYPLIVARLNIMV